MNNLSKYDDVSFYREGKTYYFHYNGRNFEVNIININKLKEQLKLPYNVMFYGMSRAQIGKVIGCLLDDTTSYRIYKASNFGSNVLQYNVIFFQKKKVGNKKEKCRKRKIKL